MVSQTVPEEIYRMLEGPEPDEPTAGSDVPQTLEEFIEEMKSDRTDAKTFALRLRAMVGGACPRAMFGTWSVDRHR